jgi:hypothetical protein
VVFLKNISSGKAMDIPENRRFLDQKDCRYEPHILLVPQNTLLQMKNSDATLHTIHMDGAATYNLPFPFTNQATSRNMPNTGLVNLKCTGGHVWMNLELFVIPTPTMLSPMKAENLSLPACLQASMRSSPGTAGTWPGKKGPSMS